jgi:hypothetical protein
MSLVWTAWNSGTHATSGAGYGFKVPILDRDHLFEKRWQTVVLELPTKGGYSETEINIAKPSFWNGTCHELISQEIGRWLRTNDLAPWPRGRPPKIDVEQIGTRRFRVKGVAN